MAKTLKSLLFRQRPQQQLQEPPSPEREESFELQDRCPDDRWKRTLKANHSNLRHEIRVKDVLPGFHSFLTDVEYVRVEGPDKVDNIDQVDQLVRILRTKEKCHFEKFLVALWRQGYADSAERLAEEAGVVLNTLIPSGMATGNVSLAARAGTPKSQRHAMKEKGMLYYPWIKSLHNAFYKQVIIPFVAFVMESTDVDFQHLRCVCEQVIRREEHPIACKVHLPTQRERFLDDLQHKHGLWKDALEYRLLREVIMEFHDDGLTLRLEQYEVLLREKGNTILMQCQREFRKCPDLCLVLKADHNTALGTLCQLKSFLVNDVGLEEASFAGFREGCIELFFKISSESASTALDPLCSHAFRSKLLSMGVRRVTLSGYWVIDTDTGHVVFLQPPESLTDHDTEDSTADVTQSSETTASITGHSGRQADLEDVPSCKRVKLNPEEEDAPVFQPSHNIEWQAAAEFQPYHKVERQAAEGDSSLLQSESARSCVADKGTSDDEETRVDGMCQPTNVAASDIVLQSGIQTAEDKTRQWRLITGIFSNLREACPILGILVIGETGAGKSTLINNLLGKEVAEVGETIEPGTLAVTPYELLVEGVPVVVYDTPGLDDARIDEEEEEKYLEIMKSLLVRNKIHLVIYCFQMMNRIRRSLTRTFKAYDKIGVPWNQSIIALTFSDKEEDTSKVSVKTLVGKVMPRAVVSLKICPTAKDAGKALPNGSPWYVPFWLDVIEVLIPAALAQFLYIHKGNIHVEGVPAPPTTSHSLVNVTLAGEDKKRFEGELAKKLKPQDGKNDIDIEVIGLIEHLQHFHMHGLSI